MITSLCFPQGSEQEEDNGHSHALYVTEEVELSIVMKLEDRDSLISGTFNYPVHLYPVS